MSVVSCEYERYLECRYSCSQDGDVLKLTEHLLQLWSLLVVVLNMLVLLPESLFIEVD